MTQNWLLFARYLVGFLWSWEKFLIALTIDNMSLGICLALHGTSAKNTKSCSPECSETSRESELGEALRSWRDAEVPGAQPTEKAAGDGCEQGFQGTKKRKGGPSKASRGPRREKGEKHGSVGSSVSALKKHRDFGILHRHMTLSQVICFSPLSFP